MVRIIHKTTDCDIYFTIRGYFNLYIVVGITVENSVES